MSVTQRLRVAGFMLNIAEWDRHLEVVRQILNGIDSFEPYEAFLRITRGKSTGIGSKELESFMRENAVPVDLNSLDTVVRLYDTKFLGHLDFEDFLKMTLTRDNPSVRFEAAAKRQIHDVAEDQTLAEEVEYCLSRLFAKACEFVRKMKIDAESQSILAERDLFNQLVASSSSASCLDFKILKRYFETLKIMPKDSEIIAILRVIDVNDDGVIDKTEFDYFIGLFNLRLGSAEAGIIGKLKDRNRKDHEVNYFGERRTEGSISGTHSSSIQHMTVSNAAGGYVSNLRDAERRTGYTSGLNVGNTSPSRLNRRKVDNDIGAGVSPSGGYVRKTTTTEGVRQRREYSDTSPGVRDIERRTFGTTVPATTTSPSFLYQKTVSYEGTSGYSPIRAGETQARLTRAEMQRAREINAVGPNPDRYKREVEELRKMDRSLTRPSAVGGGRSREISKGRDRSATPTHSRTRLESRIAQSTSYVGHERTPLSNIGNSNIRAGISTLDREPYRRTAGERPTLSGNQVVEEVIYKRTTPTPGVENISYQRNSPTRSRPALGLPQINHQSNSSFRGQETASSPRQLDNEIGQVVSHGTSVVNREIKFVQ